MSTETTAAADEDPDTTTTTATTTTTTTTASPKIQEKVLLVATAISPRSGDQLFKKGTAFETYYNFCKWQQLKPEERIDLVAKKPRADGKRVTLTMSIPRDVAVQMRYVDNMSKAHTFHGSPKNVVIYLPQVTPFALGQVSRSPLQHHVCPVECFAQIMILKCNFFLTILSALFWTHIRYDTILLA